jgi:hypothetical protein
MPQAVRRLGVLINLLGCRLQEEADTKRVTLRGETIAGLREATGPCGQRPAPRGRTCLAPSKQSSHWEENHAQTTPGQRDGAMVALGHSA